MADKTEAPTSGRIRDARERGQVARSIEMNAAVSLVAGIWLLTGIGKNMVSGLGDLMRFTVTNLPTEEISDVWLRQLVLSQFFLFCHSIWRIDPGFYDRWGWNYPCSNEFPVGIQTTFL